MKSCKTFFLMLAMLLIMAPASWSADPALFEWALNVNGSVYDSLYGPAFPVSVNSAGFDTATGLGTITINFDPNSSGTYSLLSFFDHDANADTTGFSNEYGAFSGALGAFQTWEIDEPGWVFGDIYSNFLAGTLDKSNAIPSTYVKPGPDDLTSGEDVSLALGWEGFHLDANQHAVATFNISKTAPQSGFYLQQTDPGFTDENIPPESIYLYGRLDTVTEGIPGVPEPASLLLLGLGLAGLAITRKKQA